MSLDGSGQIIIDADSVGVGKINTRAKFESALANLTTPGLEASIDGMINQMTITATYSPTAAFECRRNG